MKIEIKSLAGSLLFEGDFYSLAECVVAAVKKGADLTRANLTGADLTWANLTGADLTWANLTRANLTWANLTGADLTWANLTGANLTWANLTGADLTGADLTGADLTRANLTWANLTRANLTGADLTDKDLAKIIPTRTILPEGDLIGYKKFSNGTICKLLIPANAKRVGGLTGRKCRAEYAKVLEGEGKAKHDVGFLYKAGEIVRPTQPYDPDPRDECKSGIHFFITREEAEAY